MRKRKYPPSRIRYEREHPTITFRCQDRKEYEYIKATAKRLGISMSRLVRQALLKRMKECEGVYNRAYWEGYMDGFGKGVEKTVEKYIPYTTCIRCGKLVFPTDDDPVVRLYETVGAPIVGVPPSHDNCNTPQTLRIEDDHVVFTYTAGDQECHIRLKHPPDASSPI